MATASWVLAGRWRPLFYCLSPDPSSQPPLLSPSLCATVKHPAQGAGWRAPGSTGSDLEVLLPGHAEAASPARAGTWAPAPHADLRGQTPPRTGREAGWWLTSAAPSCPESISWSLLLTCQPVQHSDKRGRQKDATAGDAAAVPWLEKIPGAYVQHSTGSWGGHRGAGFTLLARGWQCSWITRSGGASEGWVSTGGCTACPCPHPSPTASSALSQCSSGDPSLTPWLQLCHIQGCPKIRTDSPGLLQPGGGHLVAPRTCS